jgi:hypothetical protein
MNRYVASAAAACVLLAAMSAWFAVVGHPYAAAFMGILALAATAWLVVKHPDIAEEPNPYHPVSTTANHATSASGGSVTQH